MDKEDFSWLNGWSLPSTSGNNANNAHSTAQSNALSGSFGTSYGLATQPTTFASADSFPAFPATFPSLTGDFSAASLFGLPQGTSQAGGVSVTANGMNAPLPFPLLNPQLLQFQPQIQPSALVQANASADADASSAVLSMIQERRKNRRLGLGLPASDLGSYALGSLQGNGLAGELESMPLSSLLQQSGGMTAAGSTEKNPKRSRLNGEGQSTDFANDSVALNGSTLQSVKIPPPSEQPVQFSPLQSSLYANILNQPSMTGIPQSIGVSPVSNMVFPRGLDEFGLDWTSAPSFFTVGPAIPVQQSEPRPQELNLEPQQPIPSSAPQIDPGQNVLAFLNSVLGNHGLWTTPGVNPSHPIYQSTANPLTAAEANFLRAALNPTQSIHIQEQPPSILPPPSGKPQTSDATSSLIPTVTTIEMQPQPSMLVNFPKHENVAVSPSPGNEPSIQVEQKPFQRQRRNIQSLLSHATQPPLADKTSSPLTSIPAETTVQSRIPSLPPFGLPTYPNGHLVYSLDGNSLEAKKTSNQPATTPQTTQPFAPKKEEQNDVMFSNSLDMNPFDSQLHGLDKKTTSEWLARQTIAQPSLVMKHHGINGSKPAQPTNAYLVFCNEWRKKFLQIDPFSSSNDMNRVLGAKWRSMSGSEKDEYRQMAKMINENTALSQSHFPHTAASSQRRYSSTQKTSGNHQTLLPNSHVRGSPGTEASNLMAFNQASDFKSSMDSHMKMSEYTYLKSTLAQSPKPQSNQQRAIKSERTKSETTFPSSIPDTQIAQSLSEKARYQQTHHKKTPDDQLHHALRKEAKDFHAITRDTSVENSLSDAALNILPNQQDSDAGLRQGQKNSGNVSSDPNTNSNSNSNSDPNSNSNSSSDPNSEENANSNLSAPSANKPSRSTHLPNSSVALVTLMPVKESLLSDSGEQSIIGKDASADEKHAAKEYIQSQRNETEEIPVSSDDADNDDQKEYAIQSTIPVNGSRALETSNLHSRATLGQAHSFPIPQNASAVEESMLHNRLHTPTRIEAHSGVSTNGTLQNGALKPNSVLMQMSPCTPPPSISDTSVNPHLRNAASAGASLLHQFQQWQQQQQQQQQQHNHNHHHHHQHNHHNHHNHSLISHNHQQPQNMPLSSLPAHFDPLSNGLMTVQTGSDVSGQAFLNERQQRRKRIIQTVLHSSGNPNNENPS